MTLEYFTLICSYIVVFVGMITVAGFLCLVIYFWIYGTYEKLFPKHRFYQAMKELMRGDKEAFWEYVEWLKELEGRDNENK